MKMWAFLSLLIVGCIHLTAAPAPVPGSQPLRPVFDKADLVCDCVVLSTRTVSEESDQATVGNPTLQRQMMAAVEIQDVYKSTGPIPGPIAVEYENDVLRTNERAVLFLKSVKAGYVLADASLGATPIGSLLPRTGDVGLRKLQLALVDALQGANREDQIGSMRLLQGFDTLEPDSLSKVSSLTDSADPDTALTALAVLLKGATPESVERLRIYLANYTGEATPVALLSIGTELGQVKDIKARHAVESLASSKYLSVQLGAMQALRRMRDSGSVVALIQRLDDPNPNIRYFAVTTLAEILGKQGEYAPSMYLFDRNPEYYVRLWREWWAQEGKTLQSASRAQ